MIALFFFTMRQIVISRKIWLTVLLLVAPSVLLLVIRYFGEPETHARSFWHMYQVPSHFFLMCTLIPLVCLVHGTSLIGAEVETRTITYLTTRRLRRSTILIVKFAATALALAIMCDLAAVALHYCTVGGVDVGAIVAGTDFADWNPGIDLRLNLFVIPIACISFLSVFSFLGLLFARPLNFAVIYLILAELMLSNIPLRARIYSISHQLRATLAGAMPRLTALFELPPVLNEELYPPGGSGLPELGLVVVCLLVLSAVLMTWRELVPTKLARE